MKKLLIIFFLLISTATFAQIKVLKVIGQPGIAKADSVNGYVTPTQLKSKINYTDSASMLSPYLRKNDTTGKWISPAVANATYATLSALSLKANDNSVVHLSGNETITGTKLFNNYFQVNSNSNTYWGNGLNGQLSWDASNIIINAMNGKNLVLQTSFNPALTLDGNGNGTFRGSIHSQQAFDSSMVPILGQIYPSQKKWVIFGDSFSSTDIRYWGTVRDKLKLTGIVTNAVSGNKIARQSAILDSILTANPTYFNSFNICSILIGINDFAGGTQLGTPSDPAGTLTYAGLLKHMIETILTAKPTIELYIMTPPEGNGAGVTYKGVNSAGWTVRKMSELIKNICNLYAVQVIDLYSLSQFNQITIPTLTEDGLHANSEGSKFLGNIVANAFVNRNNNSSVPRLDDITSIDSSTNHSINIKGNLILGSDGKILFGLPGSQNVISWDTLPGAVTYKTQIGSFRGQNTYQLCLYVNGYEVATLDTFQNIRIGGNGRFLYPNNPSFTDADSTAAVTKLYVDRSLAKKVDTSFRQTVNLGAGLYDQVNGANTDSLFLKEKIVSVASASTITIDLDTTSMYTVTALAAGVTFANPTSVYTQNEGRSLLIRVTDNGTSQTLAFGTQFRGSTDVPLPTTTTAGKTMYLKFLWNALDSRWDLLIKNNGF